MSLFKKMFGSMRAVVLVGSLCASMFTVVCVSPAAHAGLLLEPYLGYDIGLMDVELGLGTGVTRKYGMTGASLGARVGYALPLLAVTLDYSMAPGLKLTGKEGGATDSDGSRSTLGITVVGSLPLIQVFAGYGFMNDVTVKQSSGDQTFRGNVLKFGVGLTALPIIAVNAEYWMSTYTKYKDSTTEYDMSSSQTFQAAKSSAVVLSVSAPFEF